MSNLDFLCAVPAHRQLLRRTCSLRSDFLATQGLVTALGGTSGTFNMTSQVAGAPLTEIGHHKHNNVSFEQLVFCREDQTTCPQAAYGYALPTTAAKSGCPDRRPKYGYRVHFCGSDGHGSAPFTKGRYCLADFDIKDPVRHLPTCHCRCFKTELKALHRNHPNFANEDGLLLCHRSCYQATLWRRNHRWADKTMEVVPMNRTMGEWVGLEKLQHSEVTKELKKRLSTEKSRFWVKHLSRNGEWLFQRVLSLVRK
nr:hypothetical protein CFP56_63059 [Quercus suber]